MRSILEDLYNGNVSPSEWNPKHSETYRQKNKRYRAHRDPFEKALRHRDRRLYREYEKVTGFLLEREDAVSCEMFRVGFAMGVQAVMETFEIIGRNSR